MGKPYLGPLTEAIFEADEGQPPAIIREWGNYVRRPGGLVLLWAGATRQATGGFSWTSLTCGETDGDESAGPVVKTPADHVERLLSPLAHEGRVRIMQGLYHRALSPGELSEAVGLRGGGLYHHLRELKYAAYVAEEEGKYALTNLGRQMLVTVTVIASQAVADKGEQGLGVGTCSTGQDQAEQAEKA